MKRTPISKAVRFAILQRDAFACVYCGAEPPDVKLHVDHIRPVADGGGNEHDNLATACADCNLGKAAGILAEPMDRQFARALATKLYEMAQRRFGREVEEYRDAFGLILCFALSEPEPDELEICIAASRDWAHAVANLYRQSGFPDYMCEPFYP